MLLHILTGNLRVAAAFLHSGAWRGVNQKKDETTRPDRFETVIPLFNTVVWVPVQSCPLINKDSVHEQIEDKNRWKPG